MSLVPNQRVPSSGYNTLNSITANGGSRKTFFTMSELHHSAIKVYIKEGRKKTIYIHVYSLFSILPRLLFCILHLKCTTQVMVRPRHYQMILTTIQQSSTTENEIIPLKSMATYIVYF